MLAHDVECGEGALNYRCARVDDEDDLNTFNQIWVGCLPVVLQSGRLL